jgi:hypothetical protein
MAIMELLDACPPDKAHTGPDGEAIWPAPLTLDTDAEFTVCYIVVGGPGAPPGPAAFAYTSLESARMIIRHVNGSAIYECDPTLGNSDSDSEVDEHHDEAFHVLASSYSLPVEGRKRRRTSS